MKFWGKNGTYISKMNITSVPVSRENSPIILIRRPCLLITIKRYNAILSYPDVIIGPRSAHVTETCTIALETYTILSSILGDLEGSSFTSCVCCEHHVGFYLTPNRSVAVVARMEYLAESSASTRAGKLGTRMSDTCGGPDGNETGSEAAVVDPGRNLTGVVNPKEICSCCRSRSFSICLA
jgi:hypothetical protein